MQRYSTLELDTIDWVVNTFDDQWSDLEIMHVWNGDIESYVHGSAIGRAIGGVYHIPTAIQEVRKYTTTMEYLNRLGSNPGRKIQGISQTTVQAIESILRWNPDSVVYKEYPKAVPVCICSSRDLFNHGCTCAYSKRVRT